MRPREFLMIPGPTPVPDAVLQAIAKHPIGHRTADFSKMLRHVVNELKWLGQTEDDVLVLTASGTGAMEAAISNVVSPGDRVLSLVCGVFSERWAKIAEAFGAQVERLTVEAGKAIDPQDVRARLQQDSKGEIKAVTITHNETSTGVINDLKAIAAAVRDHGALSVVDAVTSFGAVNLPFSEWGVDLLVTGSQKALMLPPGLALVFVGGRAWEAISRCATRRFYFDLAKYRKSLDADTTPFTPNVSFVAGLAAALDLIRQEGPEHVFARHQKLKTALRAGVSGMGLQLLVNERCASPTITAIVPPAKISVDAIRKALKERFQILVADGQDALKGKIFRIGHMGYVFERDILMTLASLECALCDLGFDLEKGRAVKEAAAVLAR